jgi:hypothetical protein
MRRSLLLLTTMALALLMVSSVHTVRSLVGSGQFEHLSRDDL